MQRKLIKHGPSSHIVVLPARWVQDQKLTAGDLITVDPQGDRIIISASEQAQKLSTEINVDGLDRTSIMVVIRAAYRQGFTTITINYTNPHTTHLRKNKQVTISETVHAEINRLIGVEVTTQQANQITIQELSAPSKEELKNVYRKLFTITRQLILQFAQPELADLSVEERHDVITRMASFVIRTLRRGADLTAIEREQMLHAAASIDILVDILKYFERDEKQTPHPEYIALLAEAFTSVEQVVFAHRMESMRDFQELKAALRKMSLAYLHPVLDVLTDIIVSHAHQPRHMYNP